LPADPVFQSFDAPNSISAGTPPQTHRKEREEGRTKKIERKGEKEKVDEKKEEGTKKKQ